MATSSGTLDDQLKRFLIVETLEEFMKDDTELKAGSYGYVYEVRLGGVLRIAKKLHKVFFEASKKEKKNVVEKFKKECLTLNKLRHPNVVQFIGVYYGKRDKDDIALVMEKLECDLAGFLSDNSNIELSTKVSILHDVSYGLVYLHEYNPPIIHRDLTAHNILLDKRLRAKIADVGMAKLMDKEVIKAAKYTKAPGQLFYMPPEAKFSKPSYSDKLDIFSFGHLCLHTILEDYPEVCELTLTEANRHEGLIEKHKRQTAFDKIGSDHILCSIIIRCLRDNPEERPTSRQLNKLVTSLMDKESLMTVNVGEDYRRLKLEKESVESQFQEARETLEKVQKLYESDVQDLEMKFEESKQHFGEEKQQWTKKLKSLEILRRTMKSQFDEEKQRGDEYCNNLSKLSRDLVTKDQVINRYQKELQFFRDRLQSMEYTHAKYESDIQNLKIYNVKLEREIDQLHSQAMGGGDHTKDYLRLNELERRRAGYEAKFSTLMDDYSDLRQIAIHNGIKVPQRRIEDASQYLNHPAHSDPYDVQPFNSDNPIEEQRRARTEYASGHGPTYPPHSEPPMPHPAYLVPEHGSHSPRARVRRGSQDPSGGVRHGNAIRENELFDIDDDITEAAANMEEKVIETSLVSKDDARPLDSNLICPLCGKQYRIGQIQHYKHHVDNCIHKPI